MRTLQKVVVRWMDRQLSRLDWSAERWAREAGLASTTVTRAMSERYGSVSSVPTLHALARAASVPSIIDFLDGQGNLATPHYPLLTVMLKELLPAVGCRVSEENIVMLGYALGQAISGMLEQPPDSCSDPEVARALARAARTALYRHRE